MVESSNGPGCQRDPEIAKGVGVIPGGWSDLEIGYVWV